MAFSVNKAIILGNLGKDPELRYTQSGKAVTNFSVATEDSWGTGDDKKKTDWHNVVAWEQVAEIIVKHAAKGTKIYIEGRLQTREYDDKDGNRRWSTEIVVREFVILDRAGRSQQQGSSQPHEPARGRSGGNSQQSLGGGEQQRAGGGYDDGNF